MDTGTDDITKYLVDLDRWRRRVDQALNFVPEEEPVFDDRLSIIRKTGDKTINNSSAYQDDNHLILPVASEGIYLTILTLRLNAASVTPNWKFGFTGPASATFKWGALGAEHEVPPSWATVEHDSTPSLLIDISDTLVHGSVNGNHGLVIWGIYNGSGAADGNLTLRWAQNTANASDSKVQTNSNWVGIKLN